MTVERMSEAEVSLRVAFHLLDRDLAASDVEVAIDGAQIRTGDAIHFSIAEFIGQNACTPVAPSPSWQGIYCRAGARFRIRIHSNPGRGDVVALLRSGRSPSSAEYPLLREAIGQLHDSGSSRRYRYPRSGCTEIREIHGTDGPVAQCSSDPAPRHPITDG